MGLIQFIVDDLIKKIVSTDTLITIDSIYKFSKKLGKEIEEIISECNQVFGTKFSIFLSGSLAFCIRSETLNDFRFGGSDSSDIDIWIILESNKDLNPSSASIYGKELLKAASLISDHEMVSVKQETELPFSIKIMERKSIQKIFSFAKFSLSVLRTTSLLDRKQYNLFSGFRSEYKTPIRERPYKKYYIWEWDGNPYPNNDFILTDLHSFILFGGFLHDEIGLKNERDKFIKIWCKNAKKMQHGLPAENLFKYFMYKFPTSYFEIIKNKIKEDTC